MVEICLHHKTIKKKNYQIIVTQSQNSHRNKTLFQLFDFSCSFASLFRLDKTLRSPEVAFGSFNVLSSPHRCFKSCTGYQDFGFHRLSDFVYIRVLKPPFNLRHSIHPVNYLYQRLGRRSDSRDRKP